MKDVIGGRCDIFLEKNLNVNFYQDQNKSRGVQLTLSWLQVFPFLHFGVWKSMNSIVFWDKLYTKRLERISDIHNKLQDSEIMMSNYNKKQVTK